jgi:hypothetical protein
VIWLKLLSMVRKVPVIFTHFPGPMLLVLGVAMVAAATASSCVTSKFNAGQVAEARADLADCKAQHANAVGVAAVERASVIEAGAKRLAEVDAQNRADFIAMARILADTGQDDAAIAALAKSIEGLHRDPKFACRREPLPDSHLERLRLPAQ